MTATVGRPGGRAPRPIPGGQEAQEAAAAAVSGGTAPTRALDLAGRRFGRLTALRRVPPPASVGRRAMLRRLLARGAGASRPTVRVFWLCRCDCGGHKVACHKDLLCGSTRSCGCLRSQRSSRHPGQRAMLLTWRGETLTVRQWAARTGLAASTIRDRWHRGCPLDEVFARPPRRVER